jgi:hypothetical protein
VAVELYPQFNGGTSEKIMQFVNPASLLKSVPTAFTLNGILFTVRDGLFADKRRSLGRYSSLADSDHGVF